VLVSNNTHLVADLIKKTPPQSCLSRLHSRATDATRGERNPLSGLSPLQIGEPLLQN
jgi:hypothetical protein